MKHGATLALLLLCACSAERPVAPVVPADSVVTHTLPGDWHLVVRGRDECSALNQPRQFTEDAFLAVCRLLASVASPPAPAPRLPAALMR